MTEERVALVTGASRGIGRATAIALSRHGVRCVLTARTVGGLEETDDLIRAVGGPAPVLLPLDLADGAAIDAIGPTLAQRFGRLDILVHAAAILGPLTPVAHVSDADWAQALAVNLTAGWRLIRTTEPLLRGAGPGAHAVFLDHPSGREMPAFWGPLAASKAGMAALVGCWQAEESSWRIRLFDPGPTASRFRAGAYPGEDQSGLQLAEAAGTRIADSCC